MINLYDIREYKQRKIENRTVTVGDKIAWYCPIFELHKYGRIMKITDKENNDRWSVLVPEKESAFVIELDTGTTICSSLFKRKCV